MADIVTLGGKPYDPQQFAADLRGRVLGRILTLVAGHPEGISFYDVHNDILKTFDMKEEEVGPDIIHGAFFLDRSNLLRISPLDAQDHQPVIGGDTVLVPTLSLHSFMSDDF